MVASVAVGGLFDGLKPAAVRLADLEEGQDGGGRRSGQISNSPAASVSDDSLARRHKAAQVAIEHAIPLSGRFAWSRSQRQAEQLPPKARRRAHPSAWGVR